MSELLIVATPRDGKIRCEVSIGEEQEFDFWISEENARDVLTDLKEILPEESDFNENTTHACPTCGDVHLPKEDSPSDRREDVKE